LKDVPVRTHLREAFNAPQANEQRTWGFLMMLLSAKVAGRDVLCFIENDSIPLDTEHDAFLLLEPLFPHPFFGIFHSLLFRDFIAG